VVELTSEQEPKEVEIKPKSVNPTHMVTLSVTVGGEENWTLVWEHLSKCGGQLADLYNQTLSSYLVEELESEEETDPELEIHSDTTLIRVEQAMIRAGLNRDQAGDVINELLNAGILFRERR
jgi:hypothetical protein